MKARLTISQAREAVIAELRAAGIDQVQDHDLAIVRSGNSWQAALRSNGIRIDEPMAVAVADVGRRLSRGFQLVH